MCGMATLAMEVSSASMKVASVTVMAITHGFAFGRHVSWNESVAAAASAGPFDRCAEISACEGRRLLRVKDSAPSVETRPLLAPLPQGADENRSAGLQTVCPEGLPALRHVTTPILRIASRREDLKIGQGRVRDSGRHPGYAWQQSPAAP